MNQTLVLASTSQGGLQAVDWVVIAIYACGTIVLGWAIGRKQQSTKEYFVGSGAMNPFFIGVSLFATLLSTISYLSMPGESLGKGPVFMATWLSLPLVFLFVAFVLLPVYMKQRVTSAYELLELKLGVQTRLLGAVMFILLRLVWMSLLIYLAANAMTVMMNVDASWIPIIVLVMGFVSVTYTSLGGLRAVVVTDFVQTVLLYGGALLVIAVVTFQLGGFAWFPTTWQNHWDTQPIFSFDPATRVTFIGSIATFFVWMVCTLGGDQTSVQRFMATRDTKAARWALASQLIVSVVIGVTLSFVGFALMGYFQTNAGELPSGWSLDANADDIFPRFIAFHLPPVISGLVVAAMFAAAMSSVDSGVNSITAVVMTDFLDRFGKRPSSEKGHVLSAKILAFSIGGLVVIGSSFMGNVPGNITAVTSKTVNLFTTPIFALFFFALFVPFARPLGVWIGTVFGIATAALIAFSGPIVTHLAVHHQVNPKTFGVALETKLDTAEQSTAFSNDPALNVGMIGLLASPSGHGPIFATASYYPGKATTASAPDPISFQWIGPIAIVVNLGVGCLVSWLTPRKKQ